MSRLVVIADADAERADGLREACAVRGFATRMVVQGADALEAAVREAPDVVIVAGPLELISGDTLLEILRANPRTRRARFVFVGDAPARAADEWGVVAMPADADPEDVGAQVAELVARSSELDAAVQETREVVEGRISQIPLADLLQLLLLNQRTGTIELRRRTAAGRSERGQIHLRDGDVIHAASGAAEGEKALFRLLSWNDGSFVFRPGASSVEPRIATPTRALLLEGMRQLDETRGLRSLLPSRDAHVALRVRSGALPSVVQPLTQEVLLLLELYSRVGDIVDQSSFPDYQVLRTLQTLVERGIVEVREQAPMPPPDAGLFRSAQIRRLREWTGALGPGGGVRDAKLLVTAADPSLADAFFRLLRGLPGLTCFPCLDAGVSADTLGTVARLRVDEDLSIEFVHVPADPRYAPLWPLAGHAALGSFLLIGGEVEASVAELQPIAEALGGLPRARMMHLLLRRNGEPEFAEGLRRNVALMAQSTLVLLPLEGSKEPLERLRGAFARIVP